MVYYYFYLIFVKRSDLLFRYPDYFSDISTDIHFQLFTLCLDICLQSKESNIFYF